MTTVVITSITMYQPRRRPTDPTTPTTQHLTARYDITTLLGQADSTPP